VPVWCSRSEGACPDACASLIDSLRSGGWQCKAGCRRWYGWRLDGDFQWCRVRWSWRSSCRRSRRWSSWTWWRDIYWRPGCCIKIRDGGINLRNGSRRFLCPIGIGIPWALSWSAIPFRRLEPGSGCCWGWTRDRGCAELQTFQDEVLSFGIFCLLNPWFLQVFLLSDSCLRWGRLFRLYSPLRICHPLSTSALKWVSKTQSKAFRVLLSWAPPLLAFGPLHSWYRYYIRPLQRTPS